ncbi:MAG: hypothetical protein EOO07_08510 [Chitinophagaceae bacterium]|nr:MAG: hypothetical protein EOO07_08510 [Chitinophagaceae bacterium]
MAAKTDEELDNYLRYPKKFSSSEIEEALIELQKREKTFTDLQLLYLQRIIQKKRTDEDPHAPMYYSQMGIWWFSILFSVLFGAILLSLNLQNRRDKWVVIGFGITYVVFLFTIVERVDANSATLTSLVLNSIGGAVLQTYFWNKYIGMRTLYRRKSILVPVLIALGISVPLLILSVYFSGR